MKAKVSFLGLIIIFVFTLLGYSQKEISGYVKDRSNLEPLTGASIYLSGTNIGTVADKEGHFKLEFNEDVTVLVVSYVGYVSDSIILNDNVSQIEVFLNRDILPFGDAVTVTGSRTYSRSLSKSPVPIDQFSAAVIQSSGVYDLSQSLNVLAPSFYSTRLTYSDATDHMDPATLRGLNPDQTLILINGKRHHPSSVVNVLSVVGRGAVINDLNTIPVSAIEKIEILRDGASAQYGSDAIAGVINIVLKEDTTGIKLRTQIGQYYEGDGLSEKLSANYGVRLGDNGGYLNLTTEINRRQATNRAGTYEGLVYRSANEDGLSLEENFILDDQILESRGLSREDFRLQLGNSELSNTNLYYNSSIPIGKAEFYSFGGLNYRFSQSAGDFRLPNDPDRRNLNIFPDGFLPNINARLTDKFVSIGVRGIVSGWDADISNTFGSNSIDFYVENSLNVSMGDDSPKSFESGGLFFSQNTTNLDFRRKFNPDFMESISLAFGSEFRLENYQIIAGEEASYINENQSLFPGAQGFPGYQPVDESDRSRYNIGFYADAAFDITQSLLIEVAGRYEDYSDFGDQLSGKVAARWSIFDDLSLRGSLSSGFRAPSLHQKYYSNTGTYYFSGFLFEILTAPNNSRLAEAFGIPELKEETSISYNSGISYSPSNSSVITLDVYQVDVSDRIVLSSYFYSSPVVAALLADFPSVGGVQFFTNAIDTRSRGLDFIFSQRLISGTGNLGLSLGASLNETEVIGDIHSSEQLENAGLDSLLFDRQARALIEIAQPKSKLHASLVYNISDLTILLRTSRYGMVSYRGVDERDSELARDQDYAARWITDIKIDYRVAERIVLTIGANNLFNTYPERNNTVLQNLGRFPYNTAVTQFGFNGGFYYAGLELSL